MTDRVDMLRTSSPVRLALLRAAFGVLVAAAPAALVVACLMGLMMDVSSWSLTQGIHANAVLRGGAERALSTATRLVAVEGPVADIIVTFFIVSAAGWGVPCALAAYRRVGNPVAGEFLPLLAILATACLALPGWIVIEMVYVVAAGADERLTRRGLE